MKSYLDLVRSRRSVRQYTEEQVPKEKIAAILEAGRLAPSGNNAQPWSFIVVRDEAMKERLYKAAGKQGFILEAPVTIAVVADPKAKMKKATKSDSSEHQVPTMAVIKAVRDTAIAADHMVMAAADMGLGTCWVAKYEQEDIRPVLDVPDDCFVVTLITVGYASVKSKTSPRHALHDIVFDERYGRRAACDEYKVKD
jgi:nitroreductase